MSISNYLKTCSKVVAGNYDKLFVAGIDDIEGLTFSGETLTAITMEGTKKFGMLEADLDNVQFTTNGTAARGYFSEQQLIARFSQKTEELEATVEELLDVVTCGLVAIRIDGNQRGWISGIAPINKMVQNRPYLSLTEEFDSGMSIEDSEEGNAYTLTFGRMSATREYALSAAMVTSLLDESATFVEFPS